MTKNRFGLPMTIDQENCLSLRKIADNLERSASALEVIAECLSEKHNQ